jgi:AcrR family transcriptional regulator
MAQKRKTDQTKLVTCAALGLACASGWDQVSLTSVAKKARMKEADVRRLFPDVWEILVAVLRDLDIRSAKEARGDPEASWRDNLFDLMMTRFDLMQENRAAYASIISSALCCPESLPRLAACFQDSIKGMLMHANAPSSPLHVVAFGVLYHVVADTWRKDNTPDLAKTMAVVDKGLGVFEKCEAFMSFRA